MIRRPQRQLTDDEWRHVAKTASLNLHGAFILGIVDPVPNPSPMSEAEGEWVRAHAWPEFMTEIDRKYPWGFWRWSNCEKGTCWNCLHGRCDKCLHRDDYQPRAGEEHVYRPDGRWAARLFVGAGSESCTWWCRCPCEKEGPAPERRRKRRRTPPKPAVAEQPVPALAPAPAGDVLFDLDPE